MGAEGGYRTIKTFSPRFTSLWCGDGGFLLLQNMFNETDLGEKARFLIFRNGSAAAAQSGTVDEL